MSDQAMAVCVSVFCLVVGFAGGMFLCARMESMSVERGWMSHQDKLYRVVPAELETRP